MPLSLAEQTLDQSVDRLFELIRIPSLSADPAYHGDCVKAAQWIVTQLRSLGFEVQAHETKGKPIVLAHYVPANADSKMVHALFYGHYDVQPADPLNLWNHPPFEPQRIKGDDGIERLYGRGTADDKGQFMTFVEAARAWIKATGSLPIKVSFLIEGEEESGSTHLVAFLKEHRQQLSSDVAFICDTNMWDAKTPAITTRLRGLVFDELTITGPSIDLHSGMYGGPAVNPLKVIAKLIASLHDKNGKVTIPDFYEGVAPLSSARAKQWQTLKFSEKKFLGAVGLKNSAGEKGKTVLEQIWARPTAEVNGLWGGYSGAGPKTVLPSQAHAKITFRLVGKQDPVKILKAFRKFAKEQIPADCKIEFSPDAEGNPAVEIDSKNPFIECSVGALKREFGKEPVSIGMGGSIPVAGYFKQILGLDSVMIGFGLADDAIHSPNEKYNLNSFAHGIKAWIRIIGALAKKEV